MTERLFLLFVASIPFFRPVNVTFSGLRIPPSDFIFALAGASWVWDLVRGRATWHSSSFYRPLALFFAALCISTYFSEDPLRSAAKLLGEIYLIAVAVMTLNVVRSWADFRRVVNVWLVVTAITAAIGILGVILFYAGIPPRINLAAMHYGSLPPGPYPRIGALFNHPNMLCNYLNVSVMLIFLARALGWLNLVAFRTLIVATFITGFFALSPGFGGILLSTGLWAYITREHEHRTIGTTALLWGGIAGALLFLSMLIVFPTPPNGAAAFEIPIIHVSMSVAPRPEYWKAAFETFLAHPIVGRGLGLEVLNVTQMMPSGPAEFTDAHNMFLNIAGQTGIVGVSALLALIVHVCRRFLPFDASAIPRARALTAMGLAFLMALLYQGMGGSFEDARHIWVLMGLIVGVHERLGQL